MLTVDMYTCLRPSTIPPINQVGVVDCWVYHFLLMMLTKMFMVMREVDVCLRPATLPSITQVGVVY